MRANVSKFTGSGSPHTVQLFYNGNLKLIAQATVVQIGLQSVYDFCLRTSTTEFRPVDSFMPITGGRAFSKTFFLTFL